jgi:protease secretion system membrane fusion protein
MSGQPDNQDTPITLDTDYARLIKKGITVVSIGLGGALLWAALAPLDEGVPAPGAVSVESKRKQISHLSGGTVDRILVREGQMVEADQDLITLSETQAKASMQITQSKWYAAAATAARLTAERDGSKVITFPPELLAAAKQDSEAASVLAGQEALLKSRQSAIQGELNMISETIRGLSLQTDSLTKLRSGRERQMAIVKEQHKAFEELEKGGIVSKNYLSDVDRQMAEAQTRESEAVSNLVGVSARLAELRLKATQRKSEYQSEVEAQLTDSRKEANALSQQLSAQKDTVERLSIKAPVAGMVVDLAANTVGGTIKPGDRVLDIVPKDEKLVIEAQVSPQFIDRLHTGLEADVHFDAYTNRAKSPLVKGNVEVVSADVLTDHRTGNTYYTMRVSVSAEEAKRLGDIKLQPGMPATVIVKTGERSMLTYMLRPLLRRFSSAFAE